MQVVAPKELTVEELIKYDGSDPAKPIYLAIKGTIFDVSKGGSLTILNQALLEAMCGYRLRSYMCTSREAVLWS